MVFVEGKPIYVQIAERLCDEILSSSYKEGERVPGVREYSSLLEVNVNTTVKAYDLLAQRDIIFTKRGMGYFVAEGAPEVIRKERKKQFTHLFLPQMFQQMNILGISMKDIEEEWQEYLKNQTQNNETI